MAPPAPPPPFLLLLGDWSASHERRRELPIREAQGANIRPPRFQHYSHRREGNSLSLTHAHLGSLTLLVKDGVPRGTSSRWNRRQRLPAPGARGKALPNEVPRGVGAGASKPRAQRGKPGFFPRLRSSARCRSFPLSSLLSHSPPWGPPRPLIGQLWGCVVAFSPPPSCSKVWVGES